MYPPHGGYKIVHSKYCFEDCGHWDCMGCCYCPSEEYEEKSVDDFLAGTWEYDWLQDWHRGYVIECEKNRTEAIVKIIESEVGSTPEEIIEAIRKVKTEGRAW